MQLKKIIQRRKGKSKNEDDDDDDDDGEKGKEVNSYK